MSEARPLFLQLAELHLKNGKQPEAIALLKKLLLAEPDNLRIQVRLAELYQAMGRSGEALEGYVSAAASAGPRRPGGMRAAGGQGAAADPKHLDALIVKARSHSSVGNTTQAAEILERVPDLEKGGEPAELLLDLYLKSEKWDEATALALKIFSNDEKNFTATQKVTEALLESGQGDRAMALLSRIRIPMIDAGEHRRRRAPAAGAGGKNARPAGAAGMAGGYVRADERFVPFAGCTGEPGRRAGGERQDGARQSDF